PFLYSNQSFNVNSYTHRHCTLTTPTSSRDGTIAGAQSITTPSPVPWPPHPAATDDKASAQFLREPSLYSLESSSPPLPCSTQARGRGLQPSPRATPPSPPLLLACKSRRNATPATTTPTTTATRSMTTAKQRATAAMTWRATAAVTWRAMAAVTQRWE
ncbi:hypothetical protein EDB86DRAFT_1288003, partial [Lactarius hatsudake]